jgi:alkylhydroperoxidase family enzyme
MPLIPYADIDALPEKAREAYDRLPRKLNIFRMWANAPETFRAGLRLGGVILSKQKLAPDLRELIILLATKLTAGGEYEWVQHVPIATAAGCTPEQIAAIERGDVRATCFDARQTALLVFAKDVIENAKGAEENVRAAAEHFSPQELVETILTAGFYMTLARMTETMRVDIDPPAGGEVIIRSLGENS